VPKEAHGFGFRREYHQKQQYQEEGYFILENVIPDPLLELLRGECGTFINQMDERMADVCRATLGDTAYLFWEQYVVKGAEAGMKFSWHQDSGYVGYPDHKPYLTCWCALDDMSEENGTVYVMPFSHIGVRSWVKHIRDEESNDLVGYFGAEKGVPAIVPAGSIVVFTSINFHCSGTNSTDTMRRAYLAQYSAEPLLSHDGSRLWGSAEPLLKDGKSVAGEPPPVVS
jgi:ectoine hydroxylase-related dioxygenase (phytanoyl-CoA dioxygenase family)